MPEKSTRLSRALGSALALCCAASSLSCTAQAVAGVEARDPDGRALRISSSQASKAAVLDDETPLRRYSLEPALSLPHGTQLAISLSCTGDTLLRLYAGPKDSDAFASFMLPAYPHGFLRYYLDASGPIAAFELESAPGATATLRSVAALPSYTGWQGGEEPRLSLSLGSSWQGGKDLPHKLTLPLARAGGFRVRLSIGGPGTLELRAGSSWSATLAGGSGLSLPVALFYGGRLELYSEAGILEASLVADEGPVPADLHALLSLPGGKGDYDLYRWDLLPDTLVLDFADYGVQDRYLKRLAFFAEKPGFRGRLAQDGEIAHLHGWNAHDYPTWTLAAFYELARTEGFPLNPEERELYGLLRSSGILVEGALGQVLEGKGALISVARESAQSLRRLFMDHEASHALFFQDASYRALSQRLWDDQSPSVREFWLLHLAWRQYDIADAYLCVNELQAYLVQQKASDAGSYLARSVFPRLKASFPDKAAWLDSVEAQVRAAADKDAAALDAYLRESLGLAAGAFGRLR